MIAPDLFGPGGSNLHNLQVGKGELPAKRQHLRQRLQGNGVNHHPGQGVFPRQAKSAASTDTEPVPAPTS